MGTIAILVEYGITIAVIAAAAYFVIKKAVKDALDEHERKRS